MQRKQSKELPFQAATHLSKINSSNGHKIKIIISYHAANQTTTKIELFYNLFCPHRKLLSCTQSFTTQSYYSYNNNTYNIPFLIKVNHDFHFEIT